MSGFVGGNAGQKGVGIPQAAKDHRIIGKFYRGTFNDFFPEDAFEGFLGYYNPYWPGGGATLESSGGDWLHSVNWDLWDTNTGKMGRVGFSGITRDINGVVLGDCIVRLFRTSDGQMVCQVTSHPVTGEFVLSTPFYPDTHFYTAHKPAAVPEVAGASPSTLVAS